MPPSSVISTLKMEAVSSAKMLTCAYQTTQCHNPDNCAMSLHHCVNLRSHTHFMRKAYCDMISISALHSNNFKINGWIFIKFGMSIMPLKASPPVIIISYL
jgi:hypothetical protein